MIHRQKILMAIVQELGGTIPANIMQPLLFLYCHNFVDHNHYYDFIPSDDGPVSLQAEEDKKLLTRKKQLQAVEDWVATKGIKRHAVPLDFFEKSAVQRMKNQGLQDKSREELFAIIRESHPEYSTAAGTGEANEKMFFTIGYEGVSPEAYVNSLIENKVTLLCDVRKNAYSQKFGFTKGELKSALAVAGIDYLHIPELGIVSEKRQELNTDADYRALFDEYERTTLSEQQGALERLMQLANERGRIAITCFEAEPHQCHRSRIASTLREREDFTIPIKHIKHKQERR